MHSQSAERNTTTSEIVALRRATFGGISIGKKASIESQAATSQYAPFESYKYLTPWGKHQSHYQIFELVSQEPTMEMSAELPYSK